MRVFCIDFCGKSTALRPGDGEVCEGNDAFPYFLDGGAEGGCGCAGTDLREVAVEDGCDCAGEGLRDVALDEG